jgi:hypothetical protein
MQTFIDKAEMRARVTVLSEAWGWGYDHPLGLFSICDRLWRIEFEARIAKPDSIAVQCWIDRIEMLPMVAARGDAEALKDAIEEANRYAG